MASLQSPGAKHIYQVSKTFVQGSFLTAVVVVALISGATLFYVWFMN